MNRQTIEKFLNNTCTPEEAARVREWLQSSEGQKYLEKIVNEDIDRIISKNLNPDQPELDSGRVLQTIMDKIGGTGSPHLKKSNGSVPVYLRVAAAVLVLITSAILYFFMYTETESREAESKAQPYFQTDDENHKELTLTDGSKVRLNENSELWIADDFFGKERAVTLEGEAYFEVSPDPENPFLVYSQNTTVRVLGTSFNVKTSGPEKNVQIAVLEGRVSVKSFEGEQEEQSLELEKNQFGFVDLANKRITVENYEVENYLNWMNGTLAFDELPFQKVCTQLGRLYRIECVFADESIKERTLTANFQSESVEQVFEVISLAMNIDYAVEGNRITWLSARSDDM